MRAVFHAFPFPLPVLRPMLAILSHVQTSSNKKQIVKGEKKSIVIRACMGSIVGIVSIAS